MLPLPLRRVVDSGPDTPVLVRRLVQAQRQAGRPSPRDGDAS